VRKISLDLKDAAGENLPSLDLGEVSRLTGGAIGRVFPSDVLSSVEALRDWARDNGPSAERALCCAFLPALAEQDAKARSAPGGFFNPTGVEDGDVHAARKTLILIRDAFLMPTIFNAEWVVLFSETIKALHDIVTEAMVDHMATDGVGPETG